MEFTRHWEESLGRFFTIPELEILGSESSVEFITRNRGNLAVASYQSILTMVENGWQSVPVFAVKGDPIVFYLEMEEIGKTIDQCIEYFTEIEEYERCAELANIKKLHCKS